MIVMSIGVTMLCAICALGQGGVDPTIPDVPDQKKDEKQDADRSGTKNINIDMQLTYGLYNNMFSTISLSHEQDNFVYLLSSQFTRSNDYGYGGKIYSNTGYYENKIGFTGNLNVRDGWKTLFEGAVDNESHGMYTNPVYSVEEKEKYSLSVKNTMRSFSSFEWFASLNAVGFTHRLAGRNLDDNEKTSLTQFQGELGGENIFSATNRIRVNITGTWYRYSADGAADDRYARGEVIDDFKVTNFFGVSMGINGAWSRDGGVLKIGRTPKTSTMPRVPIPVNPIIGLNFYAGNSVTASVLYRHDLEIFRAEELYFNQKYVFPQYTLPPTRSHSGEAKIDIKGSDYFQIRGDCVAKHSVDFYNYAADSANVLRVRTIDVNSLNAKCDGIISVPESGMQLSVGYEYNYFKAREYITYKASHSINSSLRFSTKVWNIEWSNKYSSRVYTNPGSTSKLPNSVIGFLGAQLQMINGLFSYLRIENLYNNKYYLRDGYPEAGVTVLAGLRILL
jgi:hypothetical protein